LTGVHALAADSYTTPTPPVVLSVITVSSQADATRFADACMSDAIAARPYRAGDGSHIVVVLH
jgi:hypothetical protein